MNEACAAGTGSFLEERAEELDIPIKGQFAKLALSSKSPIRLGERCTVFMERDVNSYLQRGASKADLVAGLAFSVVYNYINRVVRGRKIGDCVFFQGGTAYNDAVAAAFSAVTGKQIIVPPFNGVIGAIGAALLARDKMNCGLRISDFGLNSNGNGSGDGGKLLGTYVAEISKKSASAGNPKSEIRNPKSRFRGYDTSKVDYKLREFTCQGCSKRLPGAGIQRRGRKDLLGRQVLRSVPQTGQGGDQAGDRGPLRAAAEDAPGRQLAAAAPVGRGDGGDSDGHVRAGKSAVLADAAGASGLCDGPERPDEQEDRAIRAGERRRRAVLPDHRGARARGGPGRQGDRQNPAAQHPLDADALDEQRVAPLPVAPDASVRGEAGGGNTAAQGQVPHADDAVPPGAGGGDAGTGRVLSAAGAREAGGGEGGGGGVRGAGAFHPGDGRRGRAGAGGADKQRLRREFCCWAGRTISTTRA